MHAHTLPGDQLAEYSGTLLHDAEARTSLAASQATIPVLCLDIELDNRWRTPMHIVQPFPPGQFPQVRAAAHRLKKGMRVTVQAPLLDLELIARAAAHIHVIQPNEETVSHG